MNKLASILLVIASTWPAIGQEVISARFRSTAASGPAYSSTASCQNGVTGTSTACTMTAVGGEAVLIGVAWNSNSITISSVVDSAGGTVTNVYGAFAVSHPLVWATTRQYDLYVMPNASAGSHTITVTVSSSIATGLFVSSFTGASTSTPVQAVSTPIAIAAATATFSCNSLTTTTASNTLAVFGGTTSATATTAGSGFTKRYTVTGFGGYAFEDGSAASATTYTPTFATGAATPPAFCGAAAIR